MPSVHHNTDHSQERVPELGRHNVVQYRVDGRVEVQHDPAEPEDPVERLDAHVLVDVVSRGERDVPEREHAHGQEADEEDDDDCGEHGNDLLPAPHVGRGDVPVVGPPACTTASPLYAALVLQGGLLLHAGLLAALSLALVL